MITYCRQWGYRLTRNSRTTWASQKKWNSLTHREHVRVTFVISGNQRSSAVRRYVQFFISGCLDENVFYTPYPPKQYTVLFAFLHGPSIVFDRCQFLWSSPQSMTPNVSLTISGSSTLRPEQYVVYFSFNICSVFQVVSKHGPYCRREASLKEAKNFIHATTEHDRRRSCDRRESTSSSKVGASRQWSRCCSPSISDSRP